MSHAKAFREAWANETKRRRETRRKRVETAFLPAALEIMDSPPRPLGRIILWVIVAAAAFALTWASVSKVDIVAVAEGRVAPRGKLQSVEAAESGVVRAVRVAEGDRVAKGQPLIELDPTFADADADAARSELAAAQLQRARATALLAYADEGAQSFDGAGLSEGVAAAESRLVTARIREHEAQMQSFDARRTAADLARRQADTEIARVDALLPIVSERYSARKDLADKGLAPRVLVQELEERLTELTFEREVQTAERAKAGQEAAMIRRERAAAVQAFSASAAAELSEAESIIATRGELLLKAERREALQTLTAPVDGVVNEVAITTIGQVAEPGRPLITLVPTGDELIVEAFLLNKDVGFVKPGDEAIVKLEAYPFMRYGYFEGGVEHVSPDAIIDEARGLVFPVRIKLTGSKLRLERFSSALAEGRGALPDSEGNSQAGNGAAASADLAADSSGGLAVDAASIQLSGSAQPTSDLPGPGLSGPTLPGEALLTPGMSAAVEIKTGRRSVISFLLSPIAKAVNEAGRER